MVFQWCPHERFQCGRADPSNYQSSPVPRTVERIAHRSSPLLSRFSLFRRPSNWSPIDYLNGRQSGSQKEQCWFSKWKDSKKLSKVSSAISPRCSAAICKLSSSFENRKRRESSVLIGRERQKTFHVNEIWPKFGKRFLQLKKKLMHQRLAGSLTGLRRKHWELSWWPVSDKLAPRNSSGSFETVQVELSSGLSLLFARKQLPKPYFEAFNFKNVQIQMRFRRTVRPAADRFTRKPNARIANSLKNCKVTARFRLY